MKVDIIDTHQTHCCKTHGCKYRDEDCPVESGQVKQLYNCEGDSPESPCFPIPITRVEVIDHYNSKGRAFVHWKQDSKVTYELQDGGKTLKVFIEKK